MEIKTISDIVGLPFKEKGISIEDGGFNCWGLCCFVYEKFYGIKLPYYGANKVDAISKEAIKAFHENSNSSLWKRVDEVQVPCIVVFRDDGGFISHCGVCIDKYNFIHSVKDLGVVINKLNDSYWKPKIAGYYIYVEK